MEVGLSSYDGSQVFSAKDDNTYRIALCPLPYGPTVDDDGRRVE